MELKRTNLLAVLTAAALMVAARSARASTIPITGGLGFYADMEYNVGVGGPGLAISINTCDASDPLGWTTPFTFSAGSLGYGCTQGSASYGSYTWTTSFIGPAPDEIDAGATGITGKCGRMMVNAGGTWSETCSASFSGSFDAFAVPPGTPGPTLAGTFTGAGTADFSGFTIGGTSYVQTYTASFTGTADVTSTVPEPGWLPLVVMGVATLALALRRTPVC